MAKLTTQRLLLAFAFGMQIWSFVSYAGPSLEDQILQADKRLFTAFNQCDIETHSEMLSPDLEFYHDKGGVTGYEHTVAVIRENCTRELGLTRTLLPDSVAIYPVKDFGAIQTGKHRFCHWENGKNDCGTFGFSHVWQHTEQGWRVHRVLSYGH